MAQVPNVPLPSVQPSAAPTPTQQLDAPAEAFGANVGASAANDLSQATGKISEEQANYANAVQTITNKSLADQGTQAYTDYADGAVAKFKENNPGLLAQQNAPQLIADLNAKRAELRGSLSPLAGDMYDQETRRIQSYATSSANQYVVQATHKFNLDSADGTIKMNQQLMASHPTDLDALAADYQNIAQAIHAKAVLEGTPDNLAVWETATAVSTGARQAISGLSNSNPTAAADLKKVYEDHGFLTPTDSDYLDKVLRAPLTAQGAAHIANAGMDAVLAAHPTVNGVPVGSPTNNPTNLQPLDGGKQWPGQTGVSGRFATFATPQAGVEAAVQNLQAYGSQHGINTLQGIANRWDPKGDGANDPVKYATDLGHALEIDPNAPLNMKDPALLHRIVQAQIPLETGRSGGSNVNPVNQIEAQLPALLDNARTQATAFANKYGLDPDEVEQSVVAKTVANYDKYKLAYSQQNTADQSSLLATIEKGSQNGEPLSSKDELFQNPGAAEAYARLTPTQQHSVDASLYSNANQMTGPRLDAHGQIRAMAQLPEQRAQFMAQDFTDPNKWDLTRSDRVWALNEQAKLRNPKAQGGSEESLIKNVISYPSFKSTMAAAGIKPGDDEYTKVTGAVQGEVEAWQASNPGGKLSPTDINHMAQRVFTNFAAKPGNFLGFKTGAPAPEYTEVPDADRQFILSEQARRFPGMDLNEQDIARIYHLGARAPHGK